MNADQRSSAATASMKNHIRKLTYEFGDTLANFMNYNNYF